MKKLTVLIAMLLVVALAVPTFAGTFSDVPSSHWAYDAVNELVAAGIIEGYPDGTYKGQRNLSRYEIAMIVSRALDNIEKERTAMQADIENLKIEDMKESGLDTEQAQDVTAICKALIEKNMPEQKKVELPEGLTDKQAEQAANLIEALTYEFKTELKDIGADIDALEGRVAALESPALSYSGEYIVDYEEIVTNGTGPFYMDPFTEDYDDDDDVDDDDKYADDYTFENEVTLNICYDESPLKADLTMVGSVDAFDNTYNDEGIFTVDDLYGEISGSEFTAKIGEDQALTLKPYLFDGTVDEDEEDSDDDDDDPLYPVNGVIVEAFGNTYVLSQTDDDPTHYNAGYAADKTIMAGTETISVQGLDLNFGFGAYDFMGDDTNGILGVDTVLNAGEFTVTPTLAISDKEFEERYFTLNVVGDMGPVATVFNYENIEDFEDIQAGVSDSKGFDVEGSMTVDPVDVVMYFEDYDGSSSFTEFTADVTAENAQDLAGMDVYGNAVYATYNDNTDSTAQIFNLYADKAMGDLTINSGLEYDETTANFETDYDDTDVYEEADAFDKFVGADYVVSDAITVGAKLTFDKDNELAHLYTADYAQGILTAGLEKYIDDPDADEDNDTFMTASVDPEAYNVYSISMDPYACFGYKIDDSASENFVNYALGVDAEKALSDKATLTGKLEYADKEFDVDNAGTKLTKELGFEYLITDDVSATASYLDMDFEGDSVDDYDVQKATAGVSVAF